MNRIRSSHAPREEVAPTQKAMRVLQLPTLVQSDHSHGARASVAAHGLYRPTQERPAADSPSAEPTERWCSDSGKERANVTGKSARAVGLHPSLALGLHRTEAGMQMERETSPVTLPDPWGDAECDFGKALEIRRRYSAGEPVTVGELQIALFVIELRRPRPKGGRPYKTRLPELSRPERERVNSVLLFNLGRALGRFDERKAA